MLVDVSCYAVRGEQLCKPWRPCRHAPCMTLTDSEETMSLFEWGEQTSCSDCGAEIWPDVDRAFSCASRTYLCFACAERRGAVYDARGDRWLVAPSITGLREERRPHA